jgi:hypothetical protein
MPKDILNLGRIGVRVFRSISGPRGRG